MTSGDELYRRYLAGDSSAGDQLMLQYGDQLMAYLDAFLHNLHDAEDLMLDCFAVILVKKPQIREGNFRAYLFRVARNKANRLWRLRMKRNEFSLDDTGRTVLLAEGTGRTVPLAEMERKERNAALERCLNRIAPQYREALSLVYEFGMTYSQASEVLGCSTKKIDNLLANEKKQLRQELEKEGITHADI